MCFLQNGMLGPFLEAQGLPDATQILMYVAVAKKGEAPTDGITDANPEGLTTATGKWANAFQARLVNTVENFTRVVLNLASSSTPSTRRLLDGVAMPFLAARPSQVGRVIAGDLEELRGDRLVDFHTGQSGPHVPRQGRRRLHVAMLEKHVGSAPSC